MTGLFFEHLRKWLSLFYTDNAHILILLGYTLRSVRPENMRFLILQLLLIDANFWLSSQESASSQVSDFVLSRTQMIENTPKERAPPQKSPEDIATH